MLAQLFSPVNLLGKFLPNPSLSVCVSLLFWGSICVGHVFLSTQLFYVFWLEHLIHLCLRLLSIGSYSLPDMEFLEWIRLLSFTIDGWLILSLLYPLLAIVYIQLKYFLFFNRQEVNIEAYDNTLQSKNSVSLKFSTIQIIFENTFRDKLLLSTTQYDKA